MEKKLKLNPEELRVDAFQPHPEVASIEQGTVRGHAMSTPDGCSVRPFCLPMPITYSCNETECR